MKLKFINLLLASVLLVGSAQVFTSCKDNEEDIYAQLKAEDVTLRDLIDKNGAELKSLKSALESQIDALNTKIIGLQNDLQNCATKAELAAVVADLTAAKADIANLQSSLNLVNSALTTLEGKVDSNYANLDSRIQTIVTELTEAGVSLDSIEAKILILETTLSAVQNDLAGLTSDVAELKEFVNTFETVLLPAFTEQIQGLVDAVINNTNAIVALQGVDADLQAAIDALQAQVDANSGAIDQNTADIDANAQAIADLQAAQASMQAQINSLLGGLGYATIADLQAVQTALQSQINQKYADAIAYTDQVFNGVGALIDTKVSEVKTYVDQQVTALQSQIDALTTSVQELEAQVNQLSTQLDVLTNRVEEVSNRISSIIVQQVDNNVFGTFNLPIGINSNILVAYAGETINPVEFPYIEESAQTYDGLVSDFTYEDWQRLENMGAQQVTIEGQIMDRAGNGLGKLGTVYFTANPANVDLTGKTFEIVNSKGDKYPIELLVKPSDEELTFGYTRSEENENGFYEAEATIDPQALGSIRFTLDDNFKSDIKDILNDIRGKGYAALKDRSIIASLGNAFYNQINGILPALAIRATWEESEGSLQVTSQYGLAATAFKPLALNFLYDQSLPNLPHIPDLGNLIGDFKLDMDVPTLQLYDPEHPFSVTFEGIDYKFEPTITVEWENGENKNETQLYYVMTVIDGSGNAHYYQVPIEGSQAMTDAIQKAFNDLIDAVSKSLSDMIYGNEQEVGLNDKFVQMVADINKQVNDMLIDMDKKVNETLSDVVNNLQRENNGKIEAASKKISRFTDRIQSVINRVNGFLSNPNHYLQPVLLYKNGNNFGRMSSSKNYPTVMKLNGGDAMTLIPITYTAEVVAPLYKKFVAVTNVWKTSNPNESAANNNATCLTKMKDANIQSYMNEVIGGARRTVPFYFPNAAGYTYEIVYQGVDYNGIVSGQKYYICFTNN